MSSLKTLAFICTCMLGIASCNLNFGSPSDKETDSSTPPLSGLEQRPSNTRCVAGKRPSLSGNVALQRVFPSLAFSQPVALAQAPNSSDRWYVVEKPGSVISFANDNATSQKTTFVDLQPKWTTAPKADYWASPFIRTMRRTATCFCRTPPATVMARIFAP